MIGLGSDKKDERLDLQLTIQNYDKTLMEGLFHLDTKKFFFVLLKIHSLKKQFLEIPTVLMKS